MGHSDPPHPGTLDTSTFNNYNNSKMQNIVYVLFFVAAATASPSEVVDSDTKAASPLVNCGCQCSSITFRDAKGEVQGNCLTVDSTGAQWWWARPMVTTTTMSPPVETCSPV